MPCGISYNFNIRNFVVRQENIFTLGDPRLPLRDDKTSPAYLYF